MQQQDDSFLEHLVNHGRQKDRQTRQGELRSNKTTAFLSISYITADRKTDRLTKASCATTDDSFLEHLVHHGSQKDRQTRQDELCRNKTQQLS